MTLKHFSERGGREGGGREEEEGEGGKEGRKGRRGVWVGQQD